MAQRNTPQYQVAEQAQPYMGEYSRLAEQFLKKRNTPVFSIGQGLAEAGGDIAEAYLLKKAAEKDEAKAQRTNAELARVMVDASNPNLGIYPGFAGQSDPMSLEQRQQYAVRRLAGIDPTSAVQNGPALMQMAKAAQPTPKLQDVPLQGGAIGQRNPETNELTVAFNPPAPRESEPLVEVADPNDPTRGIMVPRSQAAGRATVQTVRDRMPRVKTYYDDSGNPITLDANDPADQERIKLEGLSDRAPSEGERTAKGFLDRMTAAETELNQILEKNPNAVSGVYDAVVNKIPIFGNKMVSDDYQTALQKIKDWKRAKLRNESGAVIGDQEALDEYKTYFGIPGDNPDTLEGKKTSRIEARRQLATQAGLLGRGVLKELSKASAGSAETPDGVDPNVWKHMTPEEKALWQK